MYCFPPVLDHVLKFEVTLSSYQHAHFGSAWTELHTFAVFLQQDIGRTHDYSCGPKYQSHRIHVIMVYLPTKLGDLCWAHVGKYSSTMEHGIHDW